jgi:hypothetical protein
MAVAPPDQSAHSQSEESKKTELTTTQQFAAPDIPVGTIMSALKAGEKAADKGPTWAMVYVGALIILGAVIIGGVAPITYPKYGILHASAPYMTTLIVGSALIFFAGILRLLNEISLRRETQVQTKAFYAELTKAREGRERAQSAEIEALKKTQQNGQTVQNNSPV